MLNSKKNNCSFIGLCVVLSVFLVSSTAAQITEKNFKIYSVKLQKECSLIDITNDMKNHDVLFFGEEHNDSVTHFLQERLFELMHQSFGNITALSLEMFDRDVQDVMNEYLSGAIREKHFNKDARIWSNYRNYKPMVEFAKKNKLNVICANSASRYTNLAGREGQKALSALSKESRKNFAPIPYDSASGAYYEKLMKLSGHAAPLASDTAIKKKPAAFSMGGFNLMMAQSLWDATMAYSISEYAKKHKGSKIMQINGRFHSDEGFAIVTQLKKYNSKLKPLIISAGSDDDFPNVDWEKHKHLGNYIIITDPNIPKTYKD